MEFRTTRSIAIRVSFATTATATRKRTRREEKNVLCVGCGAAAVAARAERLDVENEGTGAADTNDEPCSAPPAPGAPMPPPDSSEPVRNRHRNRIATRGIHLSVEYEFCTVHNVTMCASICTSNSNSKSNACTSIAVCTFDMYIVQYSTLLVHVYTQQYKHIMTRRQSGVEWSHSVMSCEREREACLIKRRESNSIAIARSNTIKKKV